MKAHPLVAVDKHSQEPELATPIRFDPAVCPGRSVSGDDFPSAATYLEKVHQKAPNHRGLNKSLGYCYVWLGNMEKAYSLLSKIPEATDELDAYVW